MSTVTRLNDLAAETGQRTWVQWPVYWSAVWVGALAAICAAIVISLAGTAFGMQLWQSDQTINHWSKFKIGVVIFGIIGAFFAFVIGGWVTGKIAGLLRSETAMLHGAIVWLVAVPLLVLLAALGAGSSLGWFGEMGPAAATVSPATVLPGAARNADLIASTNTLERAREARNAALGAITALLLGLAGSVIGGWMASGEPMNFTHYRTRTNHAPTMAGTGNRL
jgi:hypothetical protein